jgi:hypothetical protein
VSRSKSPALDYYHISVISVTFRWILGGAMVRRSCTFAWISSWVWWWFMPSLKTEIKRLYKLFRFKHFQFEARYIHIHPSIHPSGSYQNHSEPNTIVLAHKNMNIQILVFTTFQYIYNRIISWKPYQLGVFNPKTLVWRAFTNGESCIKMNTSKNTLK